MLLSCSNIDDTFTPVVIAVTDISHGNNLTYNPDFQGINIVVETSQEWEELKNQLDSFYLQIGWGNYFTNNNFSETEIDFNHYTVIACFDQIRETSGYEIEVSSIIEYEDTIVVTVTLSGDGGPGFETVHPYHIVKIPKINKEIIFE